MYGAPRFSTLLAMNRHTFLFASLDSKTPGTSRKLHIRRLFDVLQLCLHRNDMLRARRAWTILAQCKEVHWITLWSTALHILGEDLYDQDDTSTRKIEFLREVLLRHPADVSCFVIHERITHNLALVSSTSPRTSSSPHSCWKVSTSP